MGSAFFLPWLYLPCQTIDERHIRLRCSASLFDRLLFLARLFPLVLWRLEAFSLPLLSIRQETLHLGVQAVKKQIARFSIQALLKVRENHFSGDWTCRSRVDQCCKTYPVWANLIAFSLWS